MVEAIFTQLTSAGGQVVDFFIALLTNIFSIFYTIPTEGVTGGLTDIGILTLVGVAFSFVFFGIRWITRLIKFRA